MRKGRNILITNANSRHWLQAPQKMSQIRNEYCIRGYFSGGFIFESQSSRKRQLQYMAIYSNKNIQKSQN